MNIGEIKMSLTKEQKPLREEFDASIKGLARILDSLQDDLYRKAMDANDQKLMQYIEDVLYRYDRRSFFVAAQLVKEYK
jgi:hypothetical protein